MYPSENVEGKEISDLVSQNILRATYQFTIIIGLCNSAVCTKFSFISLAFVKAFSLVHS